MVVEIRHEEAEVLKENIKAGKQTQIEVVLVEQVVEQVVAKERG
jgi:hypothetical protein